MERYGRSEVVKYKLENLKNLIPKIYSFEALNDTMCPVENTNILFDNFNKTQYERY